MSSLCFVYMHLQLLPPPPYVRYAMSDTEEGGGVQKLATRLSLHAKSEHLYLGIKAEASFSVFRG